ncbi:FtsK/SpoIIIE domain-containing protein [Paenarthrobacter sp. NPDC089316]|uniref:FtsK/SpoIIIE domain-containing protein n=1 Tax=unclassified Paenarthrobacter TaxID=2634190 RepID=UPI00341C6AB9
MTLECTLVRSPAAATSADPEELSIALPPGTSGVQLEALLKRVRHTGRLWVAGQDLAELTVGLPPLVSGAVLVDSSAPPTRSAASHLPLMLLTHTGPAAGSVFRLPRGQHLIGRGTAGISLPDPGMSREHALLDVSGERLQISAVGAANPVLVDGRSARQSLVTSLSSIRCGNTTFTISPDGDVSHVLAQDAGRSVKEPIEVPQALSHGSRATVVLAAGLPLLAGVCLAVATGMWMYLGFSAMSALGLVFPLMLGKRGRQECRRALDRAVREDIDRRRRCLPSAAEIVASFHNPTVLKDVGIGDSGSGGAGLNPSPGGGVPGPEDQPVWLRLGTVEATANIRVVPENPQFSPPAAGLCPVPLDPCHTVVAIHGNDDHVEALLRFLIMQLAGFPGSSDTPVLVLGSPEELPLSARFLPQVTLAADFAEALVALKEAGHTPHGRLILMGRNLDHGDEALFRIIQAAQQAQWQVLHCQANLGTPDAVIKIRASGTAASFASGSERLEFVPDLVPAAVFDSFCRTIAANASDGGPRTRSVIPHRSSLAALLPYGQRRIQNRWRSASWTDGLTAVLGEGRDGRLTFNFKLDGPHLLVAGTTGSGKSELLKTIVASIALSVPPEHATFLFIDFKGGSGLGPLAALPHCVGLLTDLSQQDLDRALESLRGEIRYREKLFAAHRAADLAQYQQTDGAKHAGLAHLILVIDEFRILVDEAPGALRELMRIATIGRSLGVHLVMATQRPQGALNADIRANVTSTIALRVQSEMESLDIINSKVAASIGADIPGRAFLATAAKEPQEFQAASLDTVHFTSGFSRAGEMPYGHGPFLKPAVQSAVQALKEPWGILETDGREVGSCRPGAAQEFQADPGASRLVSIVEEAWRRLDMPAPRSPIAAPMPLSIPWHADLSQTGEAEGTGEGEGTCEGDTPSWRVGPVALLDRPMQQRVERLFWLPDKHGNLAMIGSPSSGMQECFRAMAAALATQTPHPHLYILDANGLLGQVRTHKGIGASAGVHQISFAAGILTRVAAEMERRRAAGGVNGGCPPLVLIVAGWCSWASTLRGGPYEWAEGILHDIARDGSPLGITLLISGERELVGSRLFAAIPNRIYFPLGTTEESRFHWPRLPALEPIPGRAVVLGNIVEGQMATAQFREAPPDGTWPFGDLASTEPPFRLRPLPQLLTPEDFLGYMAASSPFRNDSATGAQTEPLWFGVAGDEALPAAFPLKDRGVSVILGSPRSGKTTILWSLAGLNKEIPWIFPPDPYSAGAFWASTASAATMGDLDPESVLLVDDADSLDAQGHQALGVLAGQVAGIILAAAFSPALHHQLPLAKEVRASGMGLVLSPGNAHDGELLGVRLQVDPGRRPGRGFLINRGEATPCQVVLSVGFPESG